MENLKKWGIVAVIAFALVALVSVAPLAFAQVSGNDDSTTTTTPTPQEDPTPPSDPETDGKLRDGPCGPGHRGGPPHGKFGMIPSPSTSPLASLAETLGMTEEEVQTELEDGKSIATLAEEQGIDLNTIIDDMIAPRLEHLQTLVDEGYMTQEEMDSVVIVMRASTEQRLNQENVPMPGTRGMYDHHQHVHPLAAAAEALGITTDELQTELESGKSIADIATEKSVDLDTIVDAFVAPMAERLQTAVENGRLTQEEADEIVQTMRENITEKLNQTWDPDTQPMDMKGGHFHKDFLGRGPSQGRGPRMNPSMIF